MKTSNQITVKVIILIVMLSILVIGTSFNSYKAADRSSKVIRSKVIVTEDKKEIVANALVTEPRIVVYDNLTKEELIAKFDRIMKSSLTGKASLFVERCLATNVDPYIALAIVFHETGCYYGACSSMARRCNNIGGMYGGSCGGFMRFNTIDEGIVAYINNLAVGYFNIGLNTPELMNTKYAASTTWAKQVNDYINIIRNS